MILTAARIVEWLPRRDAPPGLGRSPASPHRAGVDHRWHRPAQRGRGQRQYAKQFRKVAHHRAGFVIHLIMEAGAPPYALPAAVLPNRVEMLAAHAAPLQELYKEPQPKRVLALCLLSKPAWHRLAAPGVQATSPSWIVSRSQQSVSWNRCSPRQRCGNRADPHHQRRRRGLHGYFLRQEFAELKKKLRGIELSRGERGLCATGRASEHFIAQPS